MFSYIPIALIIRVLWQSSVGSVPWLLLFWWWLYKKRRRDIKPLARRKVKDIKDDPSTLKQGNVWILEPANIPNNKIESPSNGWTEQNISKESKNISKESIEICPDKKYATLKDHSLVLRNSDRSESTIPLSDCTVVAVSASDLSSHRWSNQYPIRLESQTREIYKGSKTCFMYLPTSWEKESWCKALRLASCHDMQQLQWLAKLKDDFHQYLVFLSSEHPCFQRPSELSPEAPDKPMNDIESSARVPLSPKNISKKPSNPAAAAAATECKADNKSLFPTDGCLENMASPSLSAPFNLRNRTSTSSYPGTERGEFVTDDGAIFWNLLISRLFFDFKRNPTIIRFLENCIQETLSEAESVGCCSELTCSGLNLGNRPPYISNMRILPLDVDECCAIEVNILYKGGLSFDTETRLDFNEAQLRKDTTKIDSEPNSNGEHSGEQKTQGLEAPKLGWTQTCISMWKDIIETITDQFPKVPLSSETRLIYFEGTLRIHINPPPSDRLWFGFTSVPVIFLHTDSSIGDRKVYDGDFGLKIQNKFKTAILEKLVLPNCESVKIPWMSAENNEWLPRSVAPYLWLNQEIMDNSCSQKFESESGESQVSRENASVSESNPRRDGVESPANSNEAELVPSIPSNLIMLGENKTNKTEPLKKITKRAMMAGMTKKLGEKIEEKSRSMVEKLKVKKL